MRRFLVFLTAALFPLAERRSAGVALHSGDGRSPSSDFDIQPGCAEVVRSGLDAGLRVQSRRGDLDSFEQAAKLDPKALMPLWGIAYALGPNINMDVDADAEKAAWNALKKRRSRVGAELRKRAGLRRGAQPSLFERPEGRLEEARRGLCRRDERPFRALSGRSGRARHSTPSP